MRAKFIKSLRGVALLSDAGAEVKRVRKFSRAADIISGGHRVAVRIVTWGQLDATGSTPYVCIGSATCNIAALRVGEVDEASVKLCRQWRIAFNAWFYRCSKKGCSIAGGVEGASWI